MIVMCTCGRVKVGDTTEYHDKYDDWIGRWAEIDPDGDPDPSQPNAIAHGLCPECAEKADREAIVARLGRFSGEADKSEGNRQPEARKRRGCGSTEGAEW